MSEPGDALARATALTELGRRRDRFSDRLLADLRRANREAFPLLDETYRPTVGDVLDVALGGPEVWVCWHCDVDRDPPEHRQCLGGSGGRTCQCADGSHPLRRSVH